MTGSQRGHLIETALLLMEQLYVHLPLKRAMHAINPVQELRLLALQAGQMSEPAFHQALQTIFLRLRDLHTNYFLPAPLNRHTACLPFRVEQFYTGKQAGYVVTEIYAEMDPDSGFGRGVVLTHWNGMPIHRAVEMNAAREAGSNAAARHAQGLEALTNRWLGASLPPDEDWVDVTFHPPGRPKQTRTMRFQWEIVESSLEELGVGQAKSQKSLAMGIDIRSEMERRVRQQILRTAAPQTTRPTPSGKMLKSTLPDVFTRCEDVRTKAGTFGYIRIASFDVEDDRRFVREFIRLVRQLSPDGLIIDVRGNGGGLVPAGERLLQCLTPRRIEPEKFHFINSRLTQRLCQDPELKAWEASITQATQIGTEFSAGFPLLPEAQCNDIGQIYQGPVVLVTDALCYSTTDIFAAGFQDHEIGTIIGVSENTGAGGANVWDYETLRFFLSSKETPFKPLPLGADFRVAIRRTTRVGPRSGQPLEDLGVQPDVLHRMTLRDVLEGNADLIEHAAQILAKKPRQKLHAQIDTLNSGKHRLQLHAENIDRVDISINDRPWRSLDVALASDSCSWDFDAGLATRKAGTHVAQLHGYRAGKLVAATRVRF